MSAQSATSTQGSCAITGSSVNCTVGQINNGAVPVTITITARVADNATANIVNTARVDLDETQVPDPDHDNNEATATTAVTPTADLSITKTDNPDPVQAGSNVTYTLLVENHGPSTATDVEVTDDLPPSLTLVSASVPPGTGSCNNADPVECDLGTIANGGSKTVTIVATVAPSAAGTQISNTATVDGAEDDVGSGPNSDTEPTDVIPEADLEITKSDDVDPVRAGADLTYTLTVRNAGANTATGIVVTDDLPNNVDFISATPSQGDNCTGTDPVTCNLGALANQAVATIQIKVKVDPGTEGTQLSNTATVDGTLDDPDLDNNQATEPTDVLPEADVSVVKRAEPGPYLAGGQATYVMTIENDGPNPAEEVKLTDDLPASLTLVSASPGQGSCVDADPLVCSLGTLGSGDSTEVRMVVQIGPDRSAEQIVNTAAVESMTFDAVLANNEDDATISVEPDADLSVVKTTSAATAVSGDNITWTITVHNNGPDPSTQTELTDDLPAELTLVSASPSQGSCNSSDPLVCQLGTIPVGGTVTVEVVTQINELAGDASISNSASVKSAAHDPSMPNNSNAAVLSTRAKPPQPERKVHFSLRFRYVDKHGESLVVARVYCHSPGCDLSGNGRIRILPYDHEGGARTKLTTFKLGDASQAYPYTRGRQPAGTLSFPVKAIDARRAAGRPVQVQGVAGVWKDLTDSVNSMAGNLTGQVRNIAEVTTAVANGDLTKKVTVDVRGEILELKNTINAMVDQLNSFASEVTRVAREVGTEGRLGGQAQVRGRGGGVEGPDRQRQQHGRQPHRPGAQHRRGHHVGGQRRPVQEDHRRRQGGDPPAQEHDQRDGRSAQLVRLGSDPRGPRGGHRGAVGRPGAGARAWRGCGRT